MNCWRWWDVTAKIRSGREGGLLLRARWGSSGGSPLSAVSFPVERHFCQETEAQVQPTASKELKLSV